jgi:N-acetylneuraminic acid mutarotase
MNFLRLLGVLTFCFNISNAQTPNSWVIKASLPDSVRAGSFSFTIGNKAYLGGGFSGIWQTFYSDFWEYDQASDSWSKKNNFPFGKRAVGISFSYGGKGYIGLGQDSITFDSLHNDLWEYNPINDSWIQKANFAGLGRRFPIQFMIDSILYVGTGENKAGNPLNDFWSYNLKTNIWIRKADFIGFARIEATSFSDANKGYVGLGYASPQFSLNDWYEYNPQIDNWLQKKKFPGPGRNCSNALTINGKSYIGGGRVWDINGNYVIDDFWEYFPTYDGWVQKCNLTFPISTSAGFVVNNKGYYSTGRAMPQGGCFNNTIEYTPDTLGYINEVETINETLISDKYTLYPNPCTDKLVINSLNNLLFRIEILDRMGNKVFIKNNFENHSEYLLNLSNLSKGIYFVKCITNTNQPQILKLIKI